jgi:hypothetical protein
MSNKILKFPECNPIKLGEDIYLYENFYDNIESIEKDLMQMGEDTWNTHYNYQYDDHSTSIWHNRLSLDFLPREFHDSIINFVSPTYWILSHGNFMRLQPGDSVPIYNNKISNSIEYVLSYYAGDFTGGEICFLDSEVEYQPKKNDLIIFKSCSLDIKPVSSGIRYSYLDYLIKHPGYIVV